jgi:acyl-CoA reductase-like NAD-dependent aldehyde dehydrogenase
MQPASIISLPFHENTARCRAAQSAWARLTVRQRLGPVRAFRSLLVRDHALLCDAVARELGKSAAEVLGGEILPVADACRYLRSQAPRILRPRRVSAWQRPLWLWGQADTIRRAPRGLIGLIGTWNFPILLNAAPLLQALTAGNGVLWKPSEVAPRSAEALYRIVQASGFPAGLIEMLPASREAGQQLAEADIDHIQFTGSSHTGRALAATLGRRLISSTLELSGCDAMFVLEDADLKLAARAAWFGMTVNNGQTCLAVRRIFVHHSVHAEFIEALRPFAAAAGPVRLALPSQVEQGERLVGEALAAGATLLHTPTFAKPAPDGFHPVVLLAVKPEMALCGEASFAPLAGVLPFETVADALRMDSQCSYGLGASVFSRNPDRAALLGKQLHAGMVTINDVVLPTAHPATPFGGRAQSGWGVTQGEEGLREMTVPQLISIRYGSFRPHYDLAEHPEKQGLLALGMLESGHGATLRQRLRGLWTLLKALRL